jgi:hypothetical protein
MIIRAIDPGPVRSAYVDWDGEKIHNFGIFENRYEYTSVNDAGPIEHVAIEMVASYGMPVGADVFETCVWIGRFWEIYLNAGKTCHKVYRKDVKMHLCGSTRAKDSNITAAIVDRFDPNREFGKHGKGTKSKPGMFYGFSKDVWAAMAVALTFYDNLKR